jgi:hypothetical protein
MPCTVASVTNNPMNLLPCRETDARGFDGGLATTDDYYVGGFWRGKFGVVFS